MPTRTRQKPSAENAPTFPQWWVETIPGDIRLPSGAIAEALGIKEATFKARVRIGRRGWGALIPEKTRRPDHRGIPHPSFFYSLRDALRLQIEWINTPRRGRDWGILIRFPGGNYRATFSRLAEDITERFAAISQQLPDGTYDDPYGLLCGAASTTRFLPEGKLPHETCEVRGDGLGTPKKRVALRSDVDRLLDNIERAIQEANPDGWPSTRELYSRIKHRLPAGGSYVAFQRRLRRGREAGAITYHEPELALPGSHGRTTFFYEPESATEYLLADGDDGWGIVEEYSGGNYRATLRRLAADIEDQVPDGTYFDPFVMLQSAANHGTPFLTEGKLDTQTQPVPGKGRTEKPTALRSDVDRLLTGIRKALEEANPYGWPDRKALWGRLKHRLPKVACSLFCTVLKDGREAGEIEYHRPDVTVPGRNNRPFFYEPESATVYLFNAFGVSSDFQREISDPAEEQPAKDRGELVETTLQVADDRKPVAATEHVQLYGPREMAVVSGKVKPPLSDARHAVVQVLIEAKVAGRRLKKDELPIKAGHEDARRIMRRLANADEDWAAVLEFPERRGDGYSIR